MNDETVRLSMVGQVFSRRWRLLLVFALAGALLGAAASLVLSPGYQTSANVLLQGPRQADELKTETQVATSSVVLDRTAAALRWGIAGVDLESSVTADVLDGNVIAVTVDADSAERARQLADRVAHEYVAYSTELASDTADASAHLQQEQQDALRDQIKQTNDYITQLHNRANGPGVESVQVRTQLEQVRSSLIEAMTTLAESESSTSRTNLVVMGPAEKPAAQAAPTLAQLMAGGALLGILVGVFAHLIAARRERRVHTDTDISSALGANILGTVTVPREHRLVAHAGDEPAWLVRGRRLLRLDQPWFVERLPDGGDEREQAVRYRRLVARLHDGAPGQLRALVLVVNDDPEALSGVARIAVTAAAQGEPTEVITDIPAFHDAVERLEVAGPRPLIREQSGPRPMPARTTLRLREVSADMPAVPDPADTAGVVIVTTAGTRSDWELAGLTQACLDAGHHVFGAVIVHRCRPAADALPPAAPAPRADDSLAGAR